MDYTNTNYNLHYWIPEDVWIGLTTVCGKVGGFCDDICELLIKLLGTVHFAKQTTGK